LSKTKKAILISIPVTVSWLIIQNQKQKNIYFAEKKYAGGILEAIEKCDFIEKVQK